MSFNKIQTIQGLMSCVVPEFKQAEYKGLKSGIGKERKSSKHFGCKDKCCTLRNPHSPEGKKQQ